MRKVFALAAFCLLTGCIHNADATDDASCRSYGAQPGSRLYYDCRMRLNAQRNDRRASDSAFERMIGVASGR